MTQTNPVQVSGLVKDFGRTRALDGLDLEVRPGEVHGFLGPNGAGKSTTIRVLLGLLRADAGTVRLLGGDPWRDATELHRHLAYVPGDVTLWPNLSGGEVIDLLGRMRGGLNASRRAELLDRFELDPRKKGRTVLLSSHILSEVEALCDRVTIIRGGAAVETGTLADLRHLTRTSINADLAAPPDGLSRLPGVHDLRVDGARVRCEVDTDRLDDVLKHLASTGVRSLTSRPPTLEELFLRHYKEAAA
ncbi:ATP-binding cassette domain-containing protein [Actinomadura sp. LOL_016]|uniref:ABC transporter ATP-binding protein n=1 Tax=unclassified Actinomadura TaxID=2626254 RepID=UPI003A7F6D99